MVSFRKRKSPPKVGIAFGSGGARGWAHVGVMRRLEELRIEPCCVVGTSIGSIAAASYIAGRRLVLEKVAEVADWRFMLGLFGEMGIPRSGMLKGSHVEDFLHKLLHPYERIEDLSIPFAAVATDIRSTEEVVITKGDLVTAIRASVAIPGVFSPVRHGGRYLVDGGVLDPVPVSVARSLGAEVVVAVDINLKRREDAGPADEDSLDFYARARSKLDRWIEEFPQMGTTMEKARKRLSASIQKPTMAEILTQTMRIMENKATEARLEEDRPEILVQPPVGSVQTLDFTCAKECIESGYETARANEALSSLA